VKHSRSTNADLLTFDVYQHPTWNCNVEVFQFAKCDHEKYLSENTVYYKNCEKIFLALEMELLILEKKKKKIKIQKTDEKNTIIKLNGLTNSYNLMDLP